MIIFIKGVRSDTQWAVLSLQLILGRTDNCNTRQWGGNTPACWGNNCFIL